MASFQAFVFLWIVEPNSQPWGRIINGIEPDELDDDFILENDKKLDELLKNYSTMPIPELDEYANVQLPQVDDWTKSDLV